MNFFMLSKCGEGAGLLKRIQDEGNTCSLFIKEKEYSSVYDGILEKSNAPNKNTDLIIVDSSGLGSESDEYKKQGFLVFGGSSFADNLEHDREFGFDFMKKHGINTPETKNFTTFSQGIDYVKSKKGKMVFKPSGNLPCKLTYCAETPEELVNYLQFVYKFYSQEIDSFIIQNFIEGSVISTEFFVGLKGFIHPANHTVEVKKFMNDNLGPSTGCQGNLVWLAEDDEIVDCLMDIEGSLVKENYIGPIDLNAIVNEFGIFGLEWTPRFGLDAMPTFLQFLKNEDVGKLLYEIASGTIHEMNGLIGSFAGGVRLSIPPYPSEPKSAEKLEEEVPSIGVPLDNLEKYYENIYCYEVKKEDGKLIHSSGTGVIAVISDVSDDCEEVFNTPYEILESLRIPDKQYRTDLRQILPEMYEGAMEVLDYETVRS